jgi:hypothetical protein
MAALYSDRYLKHYRTHRDNRFFPYFRHPKSPQLWEHMRDHDKRGTADIVGRFSDIPPTPGRPAEEQEAAAQRRAQHFCEALLSNLWFDFARDDRPWRLLQLPDAVIYSSGGFLYGTGQYVFDVGRTREPSGFRAEKGLTPAEYRRLESSTRPASQEE